MHHDRRHQQSLMRKYAAYQVVNHKHQIKQSPYPLHHTLHKTLQRARSHAQGFILPPLIVFCFKVPEGLLFCCLCQFWLVWTGIITPLNSIVLKREIMLQHSSGRRNISSSCVWVYFFWPPAAFSVSSRQKPTITQTTTITQTLFVHARV